MEDPLELFTVKRNQHFLNKRHYCFNLKNKPAISSEKDVLKLVLQLLFSMEPSM